MRPRSGKYNAKRTNGFASKHEADIAAKLIALEKAGKIMDLQFQVPFVLVEGCGKVRDIKYVADFVFHEGTYDNYVVADAKGCKTPVYLLKKKLMYLLLGIEVEEM